MRLIYDRCSVCFSARDRELTGSTSICIQKPLQDMHHTFGRDFKSRLEASKWAKTSGKIPLMRHTAGQDLTSAGLLHWEGGVGSADPKASKMHFAPSEGRPVLQKEKRTPLWGKCDCRDAYFVVRSISIEKMHPGCILSVPEETRVSLPTANGCLSLNAVTCADFLTTFQPFISKSRKALVSAQQPALLLLKLLSTVSGAIDA